MPLPIDTTSPHRKNALGHYRTGRLQVLELIPGSGWDSAPAKVLARVESSRDGGPTYAIDLIDGEWRCTCPRGQQRERCAHVEAVQMCTTGMPS